jgi:hypothetical protein
MSTLDVFQPWLMNRGQYLYLPKDQQRGPHSSRVAPTPAGGHRGGFAKMVLSGKERPHVDRAKTCVWKMMLVPSGKQPRSYRKSPCFSWVNPLFLWPFSIATLNYQKVYAIYLHLYPVVGWNSGSKLEHKNKLGRESNARVPCDQLIIGIFQDVFPSKLHIIQDQFFGEMKAPLFDHPQFPNHKVFSCFLHVRFNSL